jgi:hypothetical protein
MPTLRLVCMIEGIWNVLPSRIRFENRRNREQDLARGDPSAPDLATEHLRHDAAERFGEHHPNLRLLLPAETGR